ncbi:hypothetical protein [Xanthobacter wiegelii]|uniref:hypothetical protein n=1 Tax=Xanthobacter wiegelii TaxID=3119913 RepID=UPI0037264CFB
MAALPDAPAQDPEQESAQALPPDNAEAFRLQCAEIEEAARLASAGGPAEAAAHAAYVRHVLTGGHPESNSISKMGYGFLNLPETQDALARTGRPDTLNFAPL